MSGRRVLLLPSDSDSDDLPSPPNPNPNHNPHSTPLPISSDDNEEEEVNGDDFVNNEHNEDNNEHNLDNNEDTFVDVAEELSSPSPPNPDSNPIPIPVSTPVLNTIPNPGSNPNPSSNNSYVDAGVLTVDGFLISLGMGINSEFLEFLSEKLSSVTNGFERMSVEIKAKKCFEQILFADLNQIGSGILPLNVGSLHKSELEGPFVLQVDEIINSSAPIKDRYKTCQAGPKRCLKLHMTDGVTRVVGIEYRPIRELDVLSPSGFKVIIKNVQVRHGVLMLVPEIITILGGTVNYLDEARQRFVNEVNKPPRGKKRSGGLTLSQRAALAAWPNNNNNNSTNTNNNNSTNTNTNNNNSTITTTTTNNNTNNNNNSTNTNMPAGNSQRTYSTIPQPERVESQSTTGISNISGVTVDASRTTRTNTANVFPNTVSGVTTEISMQDANNINDDSLYEEEEAYLNELYNNNTSNINNNNEENLYEEEEVYLNELNNNNNINNNDNLYEEEEAYLNQINSEIMHNVVGPHVNNEGENDVSMDDLNIDEMEIDNNNNNGLILSGEKEKPFTYFSFLQEKWEREKEIKPFIRGKIKCFLMGVRGFTFKDKFDLRVLIDDGSRISQVQIDHNAVEKEVGYSAEQVNSALTSSDEETKANMRCIMKNFQFFVRQFEGTMVIEFNRNSSLPIAIEWNQGFSSYDANLLLQRLQE